MATDEIAMYGKVFFAKKALAQQRAELQKDPILIAYEIGQNGKYLFSSVKTNAELERLINSTPKNKRHFNEIINKYNHNLYIDIDIPQDDDITQDEITTKTKKITEIVHFTINQFKEHLRIGYDKNYEKVQDIEFNWQDASSIRKISLHCVVDMKAPWLNLEHTKNFMTKINEYIQRMATIEDAVEDYSQEDFALLTKLAKRPDGRIVRESAIDLSIYTNDRLFRCLGNVKCKDVNDENRYLRITGLTNNSCNFVNILSNIVTEGSKRRIFFAFPETIDEIIQKSEENEIIDSANITEAIIKEKLPEMRISAYKDGLIQLQNITDRVCLCTKTLHSAGRNGGFVLIKPDGLYFGCHWAECRARVKTVRIHEFKQEIIPSNLYYTDIPDIQNFNLTQAKEFLKNNLIMIDNSNHLLVYHRMKDYRDKVEWVSKPLDRAEKDLKAHELNYIIDKNGTKKKVNLCHIFNKIKSSIKRKGIIYEPLSPKYTNHDLAHIDINSYLNTYPGFIPKYDKDYIVPMSDEINWLLNHIKMVWCNDNGATFDYLIKYFAFLVQKPFDMSKIILVITGHEGVGKSCIFEFIQNTIFGQMAVILSDCNELVSDFNSIIKNTHMLIINETKFDSSKNEVLKTLITDGQITIKEKFKNTVQSRNLLNIIAISNEYEPIKIAPKDRRIFILNVNNKYNNEEYYDIFYDKIHKNRKVGFDFYHYLMNIDISKYKPFNIPYSEIKEELKEYNAPVPIRHLISLFKSNNQIVTEDVLFASAQELYDHFKEWAKDKEGLKQNVICDKRTYISMINRANVQEKRKYNNGNRIRVYEMTKSELGSLLRAFFKNPKFILDGEVIHTSSSPTIATSATSSGRNEVDDIDSPDF